MLRPGQKVQIAKNTVWLSEEGLPGYKNAGQISTVITYTRTEHRDGLKYELYQLEIDPSIEFDREILFPIDDEPCDSEFTEELNELISKEKVNG